MVRQTYDYAYEAIGDILVDNQIRKLFTLMSDGTIGLLTNLVSEHDDDLDIIYNRHESGAVAMADGYSRATDEIAVAVVGRGAALTNTTTSLMSAAKKGSKILLLAPKQPLNRDKDKPSKQFDQNALLTTVVGGSDRNRYIHGDQVVDLNSKETLVEDLEKILWRLERGEGPIAAQVPYDVLNDKTEIIRTETDLSDDFDEGDLGVLTPSEAKVEEAIDLYLDADATRPPAIIAGQGVVRANAKEEVLAFAERTNAILTTTMQSRGLFADHPYGAGTIGGFGSQTANDFVIDADFILAVGCSLNHHTTDKGHLLGEGDDRSTIVHVDADFGTLERYTDVTLPVHGDAKATLAAMNDQLEALAVDREDAFWNDQTKRRIEDAQPYMDPEEFDDSGDRIDPRYIVSFLNDAVSEDRIVLHDTGYHQFWALDGMDVHDPADFIWTKDFVGVGEGVKMALGAALDETRTCVLICGDGGIMMSLQEIETAARHDIPIVIAVMNDRALGAEYQRVLKRRLPTAGSQIETPDLGSVADSLGLDGYTIREPADLEGLEEKLDSRPDGPILLNCEISREVLSPRGE